MVGETCLRPALRLIALLLISVSTAFCAPIALELTGGSVIKGDLVSWNGSLTFKREQLSRATLQRLELLSGDPHKLAARVAELEAIVENLRKDNAALRQQLQAATAARLAPPAPAPINASPRHFVDSQHPGAKWLVLYGQLHWQAPQLTLPLLRQWPTPGT